MESVIVEREAGVVTLTLNRPERRNALDVPTWRAAIALFEEIAKSEDDRVLILTGAGSSFCSGGDLSGAQETGSSGTSALDVMRSTVSAFVLGLFELPIPTIAAVEGSAAGAGANLAFACDLVLAGESARFSQIFIRRALPVDSGGSWLLPRLVGMQRAKELAFFGDWIAAPDAAEIGLVNRVVPDGGALATAREWAARLTGFSRTTLRNTKANLNRAFETTLPESLDQELLAMLECTGTPEFAEAVEALFAKNR